MPRSYAHEPSNIQPFTPSDEIYAAIGKIIRGFAEIEDILNLFIATVSGISESQASVLLGRTNIRTRISAAETLSSMRDDAALSVFKNAFGSGFSDLLDMRNAVAHGTLLGINAEGIICFKVGINLPPEGGQARSLVMGFTGKQLIAQGNAMAGYITLLESNLQLQKERRARFQSPLLAHPKGRKPSRKKQEKS